MKRTATVCLFFAALMLTLSTNGTLAQRRRAFAPSALPTLAMAKVEWTGWITDDHCGFATWFSQGGSEAVRDDFVSALKQSGKFRVVEGMDVADAVVKRKNSASLDSNSDLGPVLRRAKRSGANYLLKETISGYGGRAVDLSAPGMYVRGRGRQRAAQGQKPFGVTIKTSLIDTSTGEIVWAYEASREESSLRVSVGGFGGGVDDERMFDKVIKPCIQQLVAKMKIGLR